MGAVQGKGAQAAGSTAVWRSLTSKVHSRTCGSVKGHRVRTRPGKSDGIVAKPSTRWKGETHRIQAGSVESHSGLFMHLSCPQAEMEKVGEKKGLLVQTPNPIIQMI